MALWDLGAKRKVKTLEGHDGLGMSVAFSPDGRLLASASGWGDEVARLWDWNAGSEGESVVTDRIPTLNLGFRW